VAAGTCVLGRSIAKKVAKITAIDITEEMIKVKYQGGVYNCSRLLVPVILTVL
jgi:hypothetical protein